MTKQDWYTKNGCDHAHCPLECEHPQPFYDDRLKELLCGRCWFVHGLCTIMVPCNQETCE